MLLIYHSFDIYKDKPCTKPKKGIYYPVYGLFYPIADSIFKDIPFSS